ncbi:SOS response-associated peptidase [Gottschalkiaceae bacterium SANA]|nr:SOS response-associated peptidase [Gottschalkiaceae bacterium SANA]
MCGRFQLDVSLETLEEMFESLMVPEKEILQEGELTPGRLISHIQRKESTFSLQNSHWGVKREKGLQINARSEVWNRSYHQAQRCIIPASAYFEWDQRSKAKVCFQTEQSSLFFLAGLIAYNSIGERQALIVTRDAEPEIVRIHSRMPVAFDLEAAQAYLRGSDHGPKEWKTIHRWQTKVLSSEQISLY